MTSIIAANVETLELTANPELTQQQRMGIVIDIAQVQMIKMCCAEIDSSKLPGPSAYNLDVLNRIFSAARNCGNEGVTALLESQRDLGRTEMIAALLQIQMLHPGVNYQPLVLMKDLSLMPSAQIAVWAEFRATPDQAQDLYSQLGIADYVAALPEITKFCFNERLLPNAHRNGQTFTSQLVELRDYIGEWCQEAVGEV